MDDDAVGKNVDQTKYRGLIGSLLYLTASGPDIMFVVCLCARYQANPKESHFKAAKRIMKYLKGTSSVGLWYPSHSQIHLIGYLDSDFAGCKHVLLSLLLRLSILLLGAVVHRLCGSNNNLQTLDYKSARFL